MGNTKKAFVLCELVDGKSRTEAMGPLEDVLSLTVYLLGAVASSVEKAGVKDLGDAQEIIMAICLTAIDSLEQLGGN